MIASVSGVASTARLFGPGVVGMAMGDHRPLDRPHRVDMEAAGHHQQALGLDSDPLVGAWSSA